MSVHAMQYPADAALARSASVDKSSFRNAMSLLSAAVNIVTTDGPAGRGGFTATAVCSVTDEPPTLLVCVKRTSSAYAAFAGNKGFTVNVLAEGQEALSDLFGGRTDMTERFAASDWLPGASGGLRLPGALVSIDCDLAQAVDVGTHRVLFGRVIEVSREGGAAALVHFDRSYRHLPCRDVD